MQNYGQNPGTYYYVNDHLGTPQQLITATGLVVWQAAYLPYGEAQVRINLVENNLRFPGQYFDAESGLHYNWNRYYDAQTGRYISADPIGLEGGMNVYAYVGGNPVNASDSFGLWQYNGTCQYLSGGEGLGAGVLRCKMWTDCVNGQRQIGETVTGLGGLTYGYPIGFTVFNISLSDGITWGMPNLKNLRGLSSLFSAGFAAGPLGLSAYNIQLGDGSTSGDNYYGWQSGLDLSADIFFGWTSVSKMRTQKCCTVE